MESIGRGTLPRSDRRPDTAAWGAIGGLVFAAIWAGSFVATKVGLATTAPLWLAGVRLSTAGALLSALTFRSTVARWRKWSRRERAVVVASGLLSQAFYLAATYESL